MFFFYGQGLSCHQYLNNTQQQRDSFKFFFFHSECPLKPCSQSAFQFVQKVKALWSNEVKSCSSTPNSEKKQPFLCGPFFVHVETRMGFSQSVATNLEEHCCWKYYLLYVVTLGFRLICPNHEKQKSSQNDMDRQVKSSNANQFQISNHTHKLNITFLTSPCSLQPYTSSDLTITKKTNI